MKNNVYVILILIHSAIYSTNACQDGCKCPTNTEAVCTGSSMRSIPILLDPRTKVLNLSHNRISRITSDELGLYPNLETLILRNNSLSHISSDVFAPLHRLHTLDLSYNNILSIPNKAFVRLVNLKKLILSGNNIQLEPQCFAGLSKLESLSLSNNKIDFLPPTVLQPLLLLKQIDLSYNKLLSMPPAILSSISRAENIILRGNLLSTIDSGMFSSQKKLIQLDLSQNLISDIEDNGFYGLDHVESINLTSNQLIQLGGNVWTTPKLRVLDLSSNMFVSLETASFDGLQNLEFLNISKSSNLKSIQMAAFVQLQSLKWLSLSMSAISYIHPAAFNPQPPLLSSIDLSHNHIEMLPRNLLNWNQLKIIKLAQNSLNCNCDLRALNLKPSDDARCASPENLIDIEIHEIHDCTLLGGLIIPIILSSFILVLALIILSLACKPRKSRSSMTFYNDPLITGLERRKEYSFDCHSPYTMSSEESRDSAYESPSSALIPRRPPPSTCPPLPPVNDRRTRDSESIPRNDQYLVPMTRL